MRADECSPGGRLLAFGSGRQATAFEDVADGLVADVVAEMGEGTGKTVIAPAAILHSPNAKEIFCQVESHV